MKISILSHDLSSNCLGRAYILAKALSKTYQVEIIGPLLSNNHIWDPVKNDKTIQYKQINSKINIFKIMRLIDGDVIYAIKPKFTR